MIGICHHHSFLHARPIDDIDFIYNINQIRNGETIVKLRTIEGKGFVDIEESLKTIKS